MSTLDSQLNIRLSSETLNLLPILRNEALAHSNYKFLGRSYPGWLLAKSDAAFARFILETSLNVLKLDLEHESLLAQIIELIEKGANNLTIREKMFSLSQLNSEVESALIALAYKRLNESKLDQESSCDEDTQLRLDLLASRYSLRLK